MKRVTILLLLALLAFAPLAFADGTTTGDLLPDRFAATHYGDPVEHLYFGLTDSPALYMQFNKVDLGGLPLLAGSGWYSISYNGGAPIGQGNIYFPASDPNPNYLNIWQTINWTGIPRNAGDRWDINATWTLLFANESKGGQGTTHFFFTPEPQSLFLMGSGLLSLAAVFGFRKKVS